MMERPERRSHKKRAGTISFVTQLHVSAFQRSTPGTCSRIRLTFLLIFVFFLRRESMSRARRLVVGRRGRTGSSAGSGVDGGEEGGGGCREGESVEKIEARWREQIRVEKWKDSG